MADYADLIARLEKATGPDYRLDSHIAAALGVMDDFDPSIYIIPIKYRVSDDERRVKAYTERENGVGWCEASRKPRPFTASIDAALTLVPEGWAWTLHKGGCYATGKPLCPRAELAEPIQTQFGPGVGIRAQIEATTPAIALCIAALKARSALDALIPPGSRAQSPGSRGWR